MSHATTPGTNGTGSIHAPQEDAAHDLIAEVEAIRSVLSEANTRLGGLLTALKQHRRQAKAVQAAVASLRQLPSLTR